MDFDFQQKFELLLATIQDLDPVKATVFMAFFLAIWFLPTILASIFNRQNLGKIFIANILAGLSWAAWGALLVWASTGKVTKALKHKFAKSERNGG